MLQLLGTGLRGIKSITVEELDLIRKADSVYVESYTSISPDDIATSLRDQFGVHAETLSREDVESSEILLTRSVSENVCLLVVGDPLSATTHNRLRLSALERGIEVDVVENASIVTTAPVKAGFMLYRMGAPVSLPFISEKFRPRSVCDKIKRNLDMNLHTLVFLDLREGRTMYPHEAVGELLEIEKTYSVGAISENSELCFLSKVSQPGEKIIFDTARNFLRYRDETSPSVLIVPSKLDDIEEQFLRVFAKKLDQVK